jgi:hypothetical protein
MGVAADCEYTQQYGSLQNATTQILTNWNTASALYKVYKSSPEAFFRPTTYSCRPPSTSLLALSSSRCKMCRECMFQVHFDPRSLTLIERCPSTADPAIPWNVDCNSSITLNDRLSLFSGWRGQKADDSAGLWHLMSGCPTGAEVGIAWLATL